MKKIIAITVITLIVTVIFYIKFSNDTPKAVVTQNTDVEISPFEKAKELKKEYIFYEDVMDKLKTLYPDKKKF